MTFATSAIIRFWPARAFNPGWLKTYCKQSVSVFEIVGQHVNQSVCMNGGHSINNTGYINIKMFTKAKYCI